MVLQDPLLLRKCGSAGNRTRTSGSVARTLTTSPQRRSGSPPTPFLLDPPPPRRALQWIPGTSLIISMVKYTNALMHKTYLTSQAMISTSFLIYISRCTVIQNSLKNKCAFKLRVFSDWPHNKLMLIYYIFDCNHCIQMWCLIAAAVCPNS
jgi:hypothetical protein